MYIKLLIRLIVGYVRIEVEGYYIERFINICTNKKILIWNLKREKGVKLYLSIGINDFKKLSAIARKTNCKVKILRKRGVPFLLNRYKKRKLFAIFLILILALIFTSSRYVWNVDISIKDNLELENISEDIENLGITRGIPKNRIDTEKVINELRLQRDDIAWVGIEIKGTNMIIKIVEADMKPEIIDEDVPFSATVEEDSTSNVVPLDDSPKTGDSDFCFWFTIFICNISLGCVVVLAKLKKEI